MKKIMLFLIAFALTIQAVEAVKLCRTNWPYMENNCLLIVEDSFYVDLILESDNNNHRNSGLSVIFNNTPIPLSKFQVSNVPVNGVYTYSHRHSEPYTPSSTPIQNRFEYEIAYSSETEFTDKFIIYDQTPHALEKKWVCGIVAPSGSTDPNNAKLSNYKDELSIHPNPFNEFLIIDFLADGENLTTIDIADSTGKVWLSYNNEHDSFNTNKYINTSLLTSGIYFCRIYNNEQTIIKKIVKAK